MVTVYSLKRDGNKKVTEHFSIKEFASIDSNGKIYSDKVLVNKQLVLNLEVMRNLPGVSKIIVINGYRSPEHNKAVGGSGTSYHMSGDAVDITVYDKNGKIISAKIICCIAQDLGLFDGIANISSNYRSVHLDLGGRTYKGDEIKGYKTVTNDFYKYFGITKTDVAKYTDKKTTVNSETTAKSETPDTKYDKSISGTYKATAGLNVRKGAGIAKTRLVTIPKGQKVNCYGYYKKVIGTKWLYIEFTYRNKVYTGFASSKYLEKQ